MIDFWKAGGPPKPKEFNWVGAVSSATDSAVVGRAMGTAGGCAVGAIASGVAAPVGCVGGGWIGGNAVGAIGGIWGFIAGGFGWDSHFDGADYTPTMFDEGQPLRRR